MKIQALEIQAGDRIIAYCNNKMQICTVKHILDPDQANVTLSVSTSEHSRNSLSRVVRFSRDALVELQAKELVVSPSAESIVSSEDPEPGVDPDVEREEEQQRNQEAESAA